MTSLVIFYLARFCYAKLVELSLFYEQRASMRFILGVHGRTLKSREKWQDDIFMCQMQIADTKNLPDRARYYQGVMDETELKPSEVYDMLKTSYVMFLCLFDLFGKGLPVYTFQNRCDEDPGIYLDDRAYKIFYNITGWEQLLDEEEKAIFRFILDGQARSSFTRDLKSQVQIAQMSPQARQGYMTWERLQAEAQRLGMERGIVEGERLGRERGIAEGEKIGHERGVAEGEKLGHERGIAEGEHNARLEAARNALVMGLSAEQAAQITELTIDEVRAL